MNQNVTTLVPGGSPLSQALGFTAAAVIVDNYTNAYVSLTDVGRTIPPWTYGAAVSLPPGIRQANAKLVTATPAPAGPAVPASQATLTWTDTPLPNQPGHLLQQSAYALRQTMYPDGTPASSMGAAPTFPSFTVGASGGVTKTFTLLPNQTAIRISQNGSTQFRLQVAGHQTTDGYLQSVEVFSNNFQSANSPFRPIDIRVEPSWDPQVDITFTEESGNAATVYVSALVGAETTVIAGATTQIPVYFLPTGAALWQAPNLMPVRVAIALTGGAANRVQLIAGVAGQSVYVLSASLGFDTAAGGSVSLCDGDPNAGGTRRIDFEAAVLNPAPYVGPGKAFTSGNGLFIMADNTITVRGTVAASQG